MKISETQWSWWFLFSIVTFVLGSYLILTNQILTEDTTIAIIAVAILFVNAMLSLLYGIKEIK